MALGRIYEEYVLVMTPGSTDKVLHLATRHDEWWILLLVVQLEVVVIVGQETDLGCILDIGFSLLLGGVYEDEVRNQRLEHSSALAHHVAVHPALGYVAVSAVAHHVVVGFVLSSVGSTHHEPALL